MKIRMITDVSGTRNGENWPPRGSVIELPDSEALEYVNAEMAVPVTMFGEAERATADTAEVEARTEVDGLPPRPMPPKMPRGR